jgi:hypothetical protein
MTHVVVWIDHKEARIFRVHQESADESRLLSPQPDSPASERPWGAARASG